MKPLTMDEAASALNVSRRWLQRFIQDIEPSPWLACGHRKLFDDEALSKVKTAMRESTMSGYILVAPGGPSRRKNWSISGTECKIGLRNKSTGTANHREAQKILKHYQEQARLAAAEGQIKKKKGIGFADAVTNYVSNGGSPRFLKKLVEHFGDTPLSEIDQDAIDNASATLYPAATPQTKNRQVFTPMVAVLRRAKINPQLNRPIGAAGKPRVVCHTEDEKMRLLDAAVTMDDPPLAALLAFLFFTGCRLGEALKLRPENLHLDDEHPKAVIPKTKTGKPYEPELHPRVIELLRALPPTKSGLVFALPTKTYLYKKLRRVYAKAGIEKPADIGFHITRHSWATHLTKHGATIADLVDTGAWVDPKMAQMYSHTVKTEAKRRMTRLPYYRPEPNLKIVGGNDR